jgi:hypothetical protein
VLQQCLLPFGIGCAYACIILAVTSRLNHVVPCLLLFPLARLLLLLQEGGSKFFMRAAETPWLPAGLLAGSAYWLYQAATAGGDAWVQYLQLFDQSRLTHATSLDFVLLTLLMPFWMSNDAERRGWEQR